MRAVDYSKVIENQYELDFYKELHNKILVYLSVYNNARFYQILLHCGGSDRRTLRLLNQMKISKELEIKNGIIALNNKRSRMNYSINFKNAVSKYDKILKSINFKPTFIFDQRPINFKSKISRIKRIVKDPDIYTAQKIAFLGDDDFTSILASLIFYDKKIYVFEIDERILNILKNISKIKGLKNLIIIKQNLFESINPKFKGTFDCIVADPTPEPSAFKLFLKKARFLLKPHGIGYLCFYPSHTKLFIDFQKILTKLNFIIVEMLQEYTEYSWVKETYSKSDLDLLNLYHISKSDIINFVENLTKVQLLSNNENYYSSQRSKLPKATQRILKDISKDPSYNEILTNPSLYGAYKKIKKH